MLQQCVPEGLSLIERAYAEAFLENCILWEGLTLQKFMNDCLRRHPILEHEKYMRRKECEEEWAAERVCNE